MKKSLLLALAILLALMVAIPASAQGRRSHNYYGDGYAGTALQRSTNQTMGMVNGLFQELGYGYPSYRFDRGYTYGNDPYGYRYDRYDRRGYRNTRNVLLGTAAVIGGAVVLDKLANRGHDGDKPEEPSECVKRVLEAGKKTKNPVIASDAMAFCSGQPLQRPEQPAPTTSEHEAGIDERASEGGLTPASPCGSEGSRGGAFVSNGCLHNHHSQALVVLVNGQTVGTVKPHGHVTLSRLPAGHLTYRY